MADRVVSRRYYAFTVTVPANTAIASPVSQTIQVSFGTLDEIELIIPSGHAGLTGIQFQIAGAVVLPWGSVPTAGQTPGQWIIGNNLDRTWQIGVEVGATLIAKAYNTDTTYQHVFYGRCLVSDLPDQRAQVAGVPILPIAAGSLT
jgi:hypothetical protein